MDNDQLTAWSETLDGFSGVWERVTGRTSVTPMTGTVTPMTGSGTPSEDAKPLQALYADAARASAFDRALAQCFRGEARSALWRHAEGSARFASCLRAEVFLLTGARLRRETSCPRTGDALCSLRDAMLRDASDAEVLERESGRAADPALRRMLCERAAALQAAAEEKKALIRRCFR